MTGLCLLFKRTAHTYGKQLSVLYRLWPSWLICGWHTRKHVQPFLLPSRYTWLCPLHTRCVHLVPNRFSRLLSETYALSIFVCGHVCIRVCTHACMLSYEYVWVHHLHLCSSGSFYVSSWMSTCVGSVCAHEQLHLALRAYLPTSLASNVDAGQPVRRLRSTSSAAYRCETLFTRAFDVLCVVFKYAKG